MPELVSIITPAYNAEQFLPETIASVLNQTYADWEMIIVNDCSTDRTEQVIQSFQEQDSRIRYLKMPKNSGPAAARDYALQHAKGRFLAFLDSDDLWLPEKLEQQISFMVNNDLGFSYTSYRRMSMDGSKLSRPMDLTGRVTYRSLLKNTQIATLTVMLDTQHTGPIEMAVDYGYDDMILWLSILKRIPYAMALKKDLARYRVVQNSVSSKYFRSASWVWDIYRKHEGISLLPSIWYLANYGFNATKRRLLYPIRD